MPKYGPKVDLSAKTKPDTKPAKKASTTKPANKKNK